MGITWEPVPGLGSQASGPPIVSRSEFNTVLGGLWTLLSFEKHSFKASFSEFLNVCVWGGGGSEDNLQEWDLYFNPVCFRIWTGAVSLGAFACRALWSASLCSSKGGR